MNVFPSDTVVIGKLLTDKLLIGLFRFDGLYIKRLPSLVPTRILLLNKLIAVASVNPSIPLFSLTNK